MNFCIWSIEKKILSNQLHFVCRLHNSTARQKTFDQYLIILMTRSLANVIFMRIWARLVLLRQRGLKTEEKSRKQKEENQDRKMADMGLSATEQIQKQVDKSL